MFGDEGRRDILVKWVIPIHNCTFVPFFILDVQLILMNLPIQDQFLGYVPHKIKVVCFIIF